ncbi:hypothetical protein BU17DRAFT_62693 [Hysterangium stoloniferum]|nr:hypothetical protein BU17DRAFT_62693 [Hysterangium stoloniferum]
MPTLVPATVSSPSLLFFLPTPDAVDKIFAHMKDGGNFSPLKSLPCWPPTPSPDLTISTHCKSNCSPGVGDWTTPYTEEVATIEVVPFGSTPFTFDTQFFLEVLLAGVGFPDSPNNTGEVLSPLPRGSGVNAGEIYASPI